MKLKSVRVKTPRDLKLMGGKARCSLWMDYEGIVHRMVEIKQIKTFNLDGPIQISVFDEIDEFAELKDWLDRARAWKLDEDFEKDLVQWKKEFKKAGGVWDDVKVLSALQLA